MVNSADIQIAYNYLYECLREYIWDFRTVQDIAQLEVATYQRIPDLDEVKRYLDRVYISIREVRVDDENLDAAFKEFYDALLPSNKSYSKIYMVTEVIKYENFKNSSVESRS